METYTNNKSFNWFLRQFTIIFFLLILSFGIDNMLLFDLDNRNFNGTNTGDIFGLTFDFCHYSFMTFTTVGFGEITAASRVAKFYSALEIFIGFVFVGYILSGFTLIKEGILQDSPLNIDYDKVKQENTEKTKNAQH